MYQGQSDWDLELVALLAAGGAVGWLTAANPRLVLAGAIYGLVLGLAAYGAITLLDRVSPLDSLPTSDTPAAPP